MDLQGYSQTEHGRLEQILNQFLLKFLHIVLDSRIPADRPPSRGSEIKKSDKWFNLVMGNRPSALDSLSFWNKSLMEPTIIDIILVQEAPTSSSDPADIFNEIIIERWMIQYDSPRAIAPQNVDVSHKKMYKKLIILLRSVYSMLRLFPAYKAFRKQSSLRQSSNFDISYKISSFSTPFLREEEELMKKHSFSPVDAHQGRLSVSMAYREDLSNFNLDSFISCPLEIITDYVGSPLTDPMRVFPSKPPEMSRPTSFPTRERQPSPSSPFQRPHSWTCGLHSDASSQQSRQPFSGSPPLHRSPYEFSPSPTETYIHRTLNQKAPIHRKIMSDCDMLSPPFSPSPSPSPPMYPLNHFQSRPVSIPHPMMARSPRYISPNLSDPNRHSLPPLSPRNTKYDPSSHESSSSGMRRLNSLRGGELSNTPINVSQKLSRDAKEDSGRFSSLLSSSSSPRVAFSRSSSRLSFQDDFGDCDFSCPFVVDDVDPPDSQASLNLDRQNSSEVSSQASSSMAKKSQDAAVGALVHMLRTAPPLCQDSRYYPSSYSSKVELQGEVGGADSEFFKPRKTSDALEELRVYREMKDLLLLKSGASLGGRGKE